MAQPRMVIVLSILWITASISITTSNSSSAICLLQDDHGPALALYSKHFDAKDIIELHLQRESYANENDFIRVANATLQRIINGGFLTKLDEQQENNLSNKTNNNVYLNSLFQRYSDKQTNEITKDGIQQFLEDAHLKSTNSTDGPPVFQLALRNYNLQETFHKNCLNSEEILVTFDFDKSDTLDENEFLQVCAYVAQQYIDGVKCANDVTRKSHGLSSLKVYGYGTLVVATISACSTLGFVIIPRLPSAAYEILMAAFIALAFGTLTGDALLHLIPEALAIDSDDDGGGVHIHDSFWKCVAIMLSIYALFVFEGLPQVLFSTHNHKDQNKQKESEHHGHSHTHSHQYVVEQTQKNPQENQKSFDEEWNKEKKEMKFSPKTAVFQQQTTVCLGLTTLALVIIIGDAIHNVTDGMAIGAAFAHDMKTGLSTSLAILFHELPHEFGDFVILLSTGMTLKRVLIWNFVCSLTSFVGLYIGIAVGQNEYANQWIFAVTTGMFLYVAIGDMLPEMKAVNTKQKGLAFLAQNIGVLFGMGFMVFMYFLEMLLT